MRLSYLLGKFLPLRETHVASLIGHEMWRPLPVPPALRLLALLVNKEILVLIIVIPSIEISFVKEKGI